MRGQIMTTLKSQLKYWRFKIRRMPQDLVEQLALGTARLSKKIYRFVWNRWLYDLLDVPETEEERAELKKWFKEEGLRLPNDFDS